ncbi:MAG: MFS transporter [Burkholderiales bacterium]
MNTQVQLHEVVDSPRAWLRLAAAFVISTVGNAGMWIPQTVLPMLQEEFGATRGGASLPYTATMLGVGVGTIVMGRLADRLGVFPLLVFAALALGFGYVVAGLSESLLQFSLIQGALIAALGVAVTFAPLLADVSLWFRRRLGLAVAIAASGNYMAGAIWPPIVQRAAEEFGWRGAYFGVAAASVILILPLTLLFRQRLHAQTAAQAAASGARGEAVRPLGMTPNALQTLLVVAGLACCIAMSMPQVHIVAYCSDLGYGAARGAEMLSLMLALGLVSRLASGWIADRIGGLRTLFLSSGGQMIALLLFLPFDGLGSLYAISALFGLVQGGVVACYAIIVREHFPAREAATRVSIAITATILGMSAGGWLSGVIFDFTGSYGWAFVHGVAWNVLNLAIVGWLILREGGWRRGRRVAVAAAA